MTRLIKALFVPSFGAWLSLAGAEQSVAQQTIDLSGDAIRIADLGLEPQIPSAIDLVGPEDSSAGRNRAALVHRLQCWIDGVENCSSADLNDPRVRAIRRFLAQGAANQQGAVVVHFPDQTRIEVHLRRMPDALPLDWTQSAYELRVRPDTAQASGMQSEPSRPGTSTRLLTAADSAGIL